MKKAKNILAVLLFSTGILSLCSLLTSHKPYGKHIPVATYQYEPVLFYKNGLPVLDTPVVLSNEQLKNFIPLMEKGLASISNEEGIPLFIRRFIDTISNEKIEMANPSELWQSGCTSVIDSYKQIKLITIDSITGDTTVSLNLDPKRAPIRQFVYYGFNSDIAVLSHFRGGFASSQHLLIFKLKGETITDFWCGHVYNNPATGFAIIQRLKSAINNPSESNTNILYF